MAGDKSCGGKKFNAGDLRTRLQFDTSDIVKQLKSIQREAKKATAALKELEGQKKRNAALSTGLSGEAPCCEANDQARDKPKSFGTITIGGKSWRDL